MLKLYQDKLTDMLEPEPGVAPAGKELKIRWDGKVRAVAAQISCQSRLLWHLSLVRGWGDGLT